MARMLVWWGLIILTEPMLARANPHNPWLDIGEALVGGWLVALGLVRNG